MRDTIYKLVGRASICFDYIRPLFASGYHKKGLSEEFDKTGIVVKESHPIELWQVDSGILYAAYESFAHSFWRAQELSLFSVHKNLLKPPILDFGCGDGSFASILFREIDFGVDNDPEALKAAEDFGIYKKLVQSSDLSMPLAENSVRSIFSNSVLEHLKDLKGMISEINRILLDDGIFMFTVPVTQFQYDLSKYFGVKRSKRINAEYYHRNLLDVDEWKRLFENRGFSIVLLKQYQPDWFTFWYVMFRIFGKRGIGHFIPEIHRKVWKNFKHLIIDMVRSSIVETKQGANIFVIAKKEKSLKL